MENIAPITIAMVAGEPSGDLLGAGLMKALLRHNPNIRFIGIGGPKMIALGFCSSFPMDMLSVNGLVEVIRHFPAIARMRSQLIDKLSIIKPDLFIGIDSPDFNLDLETKLRQKGILTMHYISPTIWAWRPGRIHTIAKACDHMLVLFPFEAALYKKHAISATYVGHPLADDIADEPQTHACRQRFGCEKNHPVFTLLPGSRRSEVHFHSNLMIETAQKLFHRYPNSIFLVPAATQATKVIFTEAIKHPSAIHLPIVVIDGQSSEAIQAADVVICASGTATLETALWKKPMVITYKTSWLTWQIASRMVKLTCVGLPNILLANEVVPEYLQDKATPDNLSEAAIEWIEHPDQTEALRQQFINLHHLLRQNASEKAAQAVICALKKD